MPFVLDYSLVIGIITVMQETAKEKATRRIAQFLKNAESEKKYSQHASESFLRKARQLMLEFFGTEDLSQFEANASTEGEFYGLGGLEFRPQDSLFFRRKQQWFTNLCGCVSEVTNCRIVLPKVETTCLIYGTEETVTVAVQLFEFLLKQMENCFKVLKKSNKDLNKQEYFLGFSSGCFNAIMEEKATEKADSQALILAGNQLMRIDKMLTLLHGSLKNESEKEQEKEKASQSYLEGYHDGLTHKKVRI